MKKLFILMIATVLFNQCTTQKAIARSQSAKVETTSQGKEIFTLDTKQGVFLSNVNLDIHFLGVTQDSRCPKGAQCAWAGNARVSIKVNNTLFTLDTSNLPSNDFRNKRFVNGYTYTLVRLFPERENNAEKVEYYIQLKIERGNKT